MSREDGIEAGARLRDNAAIQRKRNLRMSRSICFMSIVALVFLMGCEDKKAATPKPRLATTMPAREPDMRTMTALLDKSAPADLRQGAPGTTTASPKLPSGHPPMGGTSPPKGEGLQSGHPPISGETPPAYEAAKG